VSSARQGLLDKGLVEAAGHGRLKFTMPGFAEFVRTQTDTPWDGLSGAITHATLPPTNRREPPGDRPELPPDADCWVAGRLRLTEPRQDGQLMSIGSM
jgi:hypothetical protein